MAEIKQILVLIVSLLVVSTVSLYANGTSESEYEGTPHKPHKSPNINLMSGESKNVNRNIDTKKAARLEKSANWDEHAHNIFIDFLEEEISSQFSKIGWKKFEVSFEEKTGKYFSREKLKNHWNVMKRDWKLFKTLMQGETGLRGDATKNIFVADNSWWEQKIANKKEYKNFKDRGLSLLSFRYDGLFSDIAATCFHAPASTQVNISEEVGSEDEFKEGQDEDHGSRCDNNDNTCICIEPSYNPSNFEPSSSNTRKRKVDVSYEKQSKKKKIGDASLKEENQITTTSLDNGPTIKKSLDVLYALPRYALTPSVRYYASSIFAKKEMREIFMGQPTNDERIGWLQYHYDKCS